MNDQNIILMGSPGAGKTSVGQELIKYYPEKTLVDVDDDILETYWKCTVADKLAEVGDENFIYEEGEALLKNIPKNTVLCLSGSNPLHEASMSATRKTGITVFIDTPKDIILNRLKEMKIDRIVGQSSQTIGDILDYRSSFYEKSYDIRISVLHGETPAQIAKKIYTTLQKKELFISTRGFFDERFSFFDVIKQGLAPDGGLFIPKTLPQISLEEIIRMKKLSYPERVKRVLEKFSLGETSPQRLLEMAKKAYYDFDRQKVCPLNKISHNQYLLELFHGPTASFKDMALQLTPQLFSEANQKSDDKYLIVTATSGDTGIAAIEGFKRQKDMAVMVLYPSNGVSEVQKTQMQTAAGENVFVLGINSDFDFCQSTVKEIFADQRLKEEILEKFKVKLSAANSMNWGRLLPQVVYYFSAYIDLLEKGEIEAGEKIDVCVPSGNFGNILGAFIAKEMGLPIEKFICASNENNILTEFLNTGEYDIREKDLILTSSPSIDILKSSNIERFLYFLTQDTSKVKEWFTSLIEKKYFSVDQKTLTKIKDIFIADFATEQEVKDTIVNTLKETGEVLDTHTAVAVKIAQKYQAKRKIIISSTAHFCKFAPAIITALGEELDGENMFSTIEKKAPRAEIHSHLRKLFSRKKIHSTVEDANYNKITNQLTSFIKQVF